MREKVTFRDRVDTHFKIIDNKFITEKDRGRELKRRMDEWSISKWVNE